MHQRNTPDTLGNGMVLKFQVRAKENSGIAFLLQARVEIPDTSRELPRNTSLHGHNMYIKSRHDLQKIS